MNKMRPAALSAMERDLRKKAEQALVVTTISTVALVACFGLLIGRF
jgi:hypothetical protein